MSWLGCEEKITWEPSSSLSQTLINEFEKGVLYTEAVQADVRFGAMHHTLTVTTKVISEPPLKKLNHTADKFNNGKGSLI